MKHFSFQQVVLKQLDIHMKVRLDAEVTTITKINLKRITTLYVKHETIKFL
jgi:hypothetical protein